MEEEVEVPAGDDDGRHARRPDIEVGLWWNVFVVQNYECDPVVGVAVDLQGATAPIGHFRTAQA
ncbi:hypothetical protein CLM85_18640 [Streptomyces albidoflavus]|nr:hypothetical protein CLM81_00705 [Streptomyces albidoflavus]PAX92464.1 hypothetical protein CLM82_03175 [Streptomyces albidoflavus]PBO20091.1 hypothetical protein CLM83_02525 [Streptomyces albidoflavus]PBO22988.1 hypothetical protein CLM85_18640 [Streptomyces albidoflavus]